MVVEILVITEGATEREVGKVLYERGLLNQNGKPQPPNWKSLFRRSREGYDQVINALSNHPISSEQRILLIFDQEDASSPQNRANRIAKDLSSLNTEIWSSLSWDPLGEHPNLFKAQVRGAYMVLHISDAAAPSVTDQDEATAPRIKNKDFDGYILQLLSGPEKTTISSQIVPSSALVPQLLRKAEVEFTNLMNNNSYPWVRNKAWLYAYITAFQFRQSHVSFAKKVVECASDAELRRVFASLIQAWNCLVQNGETCP